MEEFEPVEFPVDGVLDLHTFNPRDVGTLIPDYLDACRSQGIFHVRIIHGKGMGMLRKTVHSILGRTAGIGSFSTAGENAGGWGATLVVLKPEGIQNGHCPPSPGS